MLLLLSAAAFVRLRLKGNKPIGTWSKTVPLPPVVHCLAEQRHALRSHTIKWLYNCHKHFTVSIQSISQYFNEIHKKDETELVLFFQNLAKWSKFAARIDINFFFLFYQQFLSVSPLKSYYIDAEGSSGAQIWQLFNFLKTFLEPIFI